MVPLSPFITQVHTLCSFLPNSLHLVLPALLSLLLANPRAWICTCFDSDVTYPAGKKAHLYSRQWNDSSNFLKASWHHLPSIHHQCQVPLQHTQTSPRTGRSRAQPPGHSFQSKSGGKPGTNHFVTCKVAHIPASVLGNAKNKTTVYLHKSIDF